MKKKKKTSTFFATITPIAKPSLESIGQGQLFMGTLGLLPTPQAIDGSGEGRPLRLKKDMKRNPNTPGSWRGDLKDHIAMLPTPTANDHKSRGRNSRQVGIDNLMKLLPTPEASNSEGYQTAHGKKYPRLGAAIVTYSQGASPASLFPKPANDSAPRMTATSGRKCLELYEFSSRHGSSLKMCVGLLLGTTAWYSNKCALTWKVTATKSKRLLFQLSPQTLPTAEIGSGLLPTVRASEGEGGVASNTEYKNGSFSRQNKDGVRHGVKVQDVVAMLPTPRAANPGSRPNGKGGKILNEEVGIKNGLRLQPNFVAWMMGYPLNWTDLNSPKPGIGQNN